MIDSFRKHSVRPTQLQYLFSHYVFNVRHRHSNIYSTALLTLYTWQLHVTVWLSLLHSPLCYWLLCFLSYNHWKSTVLLMSINLSSVLYTSCVWYCILAVVRYRDIVIVIRSVCYQPQLFCYTYYFSSGYRSLRILKVCLVHHRLWGECEAWGSHGKV